MNRGNILIVDDNVSIFQSLQVNFSDFGFDCLWAKNEAETLDMLARFKIEAVLLDLSLGKENGLAVLEKIILLRPGCPVVMITGYGTLETAVKAIKMGAYEFLAKPLDFKNLLDIVEQAIRFSAANAKPEAACANGARSSGDHFSEILTQSEDVLAMLRKAKLLAQTDMPILISGESGCGKELVAGYIHAHSRRAAKPMLRINCSAFPDSLIDNELFGHEKGAYTGADSSFPGIFEQADRGTLHLDEIGDMTLASQAKILRVLEDGMVRRLGGSENRRVDVRVIASTNQNLPALIKNRLFREDLFYRLKAAFIYLPPLRERRGDVRFVAEKLLAAAAPGKTFAPEAMAALERHVWPGNIRELKNAVQMCAAISAGGVVGLSDLPPITLDDAPKPERPPAGETPVKSLGDMEREAIQTALREEGFNKRRTSQRLGISYKTLYNKMKAYGIE